MALRARDHVPAVAALLSAAALALVFAAVTGSIPAAYVPDPGPAILSAFTHLNAVISVIAIGTIATGWRAIRNGDVQRHRALMGLSTVLFGTFLTCYLWRLTLLGTAEFPGPEVYYRYVYLPFLAVHILLAIVCIPLVCYALVSALTRPVAAIPETAHRRVGRIAAPLWIVSFAMGVGVYLLLHHVF
jgi:putative membrane protein